MCWYLQQLLRPKLYILCLQLPLTCVPYSVFTAGNNWPGSAIFILSSGIYSSCPTSKTITCPVCNLLGSTTHICNIAMQERICGGNGGFAEGRSVSHSGSVTRQPSPHLHIQLHLPSSFPICRYICSWRAIFCTHQPFPGSNQNPPPSLSWSLY